MRGTVHRALRLQHHSHTGKWLHHHHTSYQALAVVLMATALSISTIQRAAADDIAVSATVPAASLTVPAQITNPVPSDVIAGANITVSGTCQVVVNGTIVVIERDGNAIGSAPCQSNGTFSLPLTLNIGQNALLPRSITGQGVQGPDGTPVTLTWTPPAPDPGNTPSPSTGGAAAPTTPGTGGQSGQTSGVLQITPTNDGVLNYQVGQSTILTFEIKAGETPYTLVIDWGDGSPLELVTVNSPGTLSFSHIYTRTGFHVITVKGTDSAGTESTMQIVGATSFAAPVTVIGSPQVGVGGLFSAFESPIARIIWGLYVALAGIVVALWLVMPQRPMLGHVVVVAEPHTHGRANKLKGR